ncbi:MAG: HEPN domain-containing protein [Nanoarchaeota archaeon]
MNIEECFQKKLLKKVAPDLLKARNSLSIAEKKLERAQELLLDDFFAEAFITAYTAMFHTARSVLYKDGIQEKGHYAVYVYISEKYSGKISSSLIEAFYAYQSERHKLLYGFEDDSSKEEVNSIIDYAEQLLEEVRKFV